MESEENQEKFANHSKIVHSLIQQEAYVLGDWQESYFWYIDKLVYTFFNRVFAVRILEELELLEESTFIPQSDLGNRSARMAKIQERYPERTVNEWYDFLLLDAFQEISQEVKLLFDEKEIDSMVWPDGEVIEQVIRELNSLNPDIYKTEDCIGWFYHYYVVKFRKGYKTMGSHGKKLPPNSYYLSILNTVYTPHWVVQFLVDNALGHWWSNKYNTSQIFYKKPFYISKVGHKVVLTTDNLKEIKILDPACGSGNFLVYTFKLLVRLYHEAFPEMDYSTIIENVLSRNLFGIDINRRPAQLSALALYILAKRTLKEHAPSELPTFQMPPVNIVCCDIRTPPSQEKTFLLQQVPDYLKKFIKDVDDLFNNADQLGSLLDVRSLKNQLFDLNKREKNKLDTYFSLNKKPDVMYDMKDLIEVIDKIIYHQTKQNIGVQMFGTQTKNALSLAQILTQKYDIIVTNPPFGYSMKEVQPILRKIYPHSYRDLISAFIDQSLRLTKKNAFIAMITDFSFLHVSKFQNFREKILLKKSYIQYLLLTEPGVLPDAGNIPSLLLIRKTTANEEMEGLYSQLSVFNGDLNTPEKKLRESIQVINSWNLNQRVPSSWKKIPQTRFLQLPRATIDLNIGDKFGTIIDFFNIYPRMDISLLSQQEKKNLSQKHLTRCFQGISTGKNDIFVRYWFEIASNYIRPTEKLSNPSEISQFTHTPYVPFSKGGGDIRYYSNNSYIVWWNKESIDTMGKLDSALRNPSFMGNFNLQWSKVSRPRARFCIAQNGLCVDGATMGIKIIIKDLNKFTLLAYLNSKLGSFYGRLQTKDRSWHAGIVARFPVPIDFLQKNQERLRALAKESFELRRDWDTGYPMSPIFAESLIDKVIPSNPTLIDPGIPQTGHPFCNEYYPCRSETAKKISEKKAKTDEQTIKSLLNAVNLRFDLLTNRLLEIDREIDKITNEMFDSDTIATLEQYYTDQIGSLGYKPDLTVWCKDFLMCIVLEILKESKNGVVASTNIQDEKGTIYERFLDRLSRKFGLNLNSIQPILKELEEFIEKPPKQWLAEDFFFYHCQRFGGRPIVWQFSSRSTPKAEAAIDLFVDYHQINETTLAMIRVDYVQPFLKNLERRKDLGTLSEEEYYKLNELTDFVKAFLALEQGYTQTPTPNTLTGRKVRPGAGDDKTWDWAFKEAQKIIQKGYHPDHKKGVLVNLIPLSLEVPENRKMELKKDWKFLCPKGTIKYVLKKVGSLDQLKESKT